MPGPSSSIDPSSASSFLTNRDQLRLDSQLGDQLKAMHLAGEERETQMMAASLNIGYVNLAGFPIDKEVLAMISEEDARRASVVAFFREGKKLRIATADPLHELLMELIGRFTAQEFEVGLYLISRPSLERALKVYKQVVVTAAHAQGDVLDLSDVSSSQAKEAVQSLTKLGTELRSVPVTELEGAIVRAAIGLEASDIHLEGGEEEAVLRFRLDGVLHEAAKLPRATADALVTRLKLLSGVKVNVRDVPQDGRFSVQTQEGLTDVRFSSLPTGVGESLVLRLLGTGPALTLEELGMRPEALKVLREAVSAPYGLVLTTGPTGSGKTTALYAALRFRLSPEVKIVTLENPVEVKAPGIQQVDVDPEKGLTFAGALRSVLRQDPNIILVGEIRDAETAETAAQAAQTGHLVLSTLHANDAAGAVTRLLSMGTRPDIIGSALTAVMAQRLIRKLCTACRKEVAVSSEQLAILKEELGTLFPGKISKLFLVAEKGCTKCGGTGYKGRIGIYEIFHADEHMRALVQEHAPAHVILEAALKQGMITMRQDGLLKALEGVTSLEEVDRVTKT